MTSVSSEVVSGGDIQPKVLRSSSRRGSATLLVVAIGYAGVSQGGFYWGQLRLTAVLVLAAFAVSAAESRLSWRDVHGPIAPALVLAGWYLAAGLSAGNAGGAFPAVMLLAAMAATVIIMRRLDPNERRVALAGLVGVGVLIALTGWAGVAWRQAPHALEDGGVWRAASTITYANATGGMLAALALVALGAFVIEDRPRVFTLVTYLLLVGLCATASRAALVSFAVGLSVLALWTRGRVLVKNAPALIGAPIAFVALAPSMQSTHAPEPLLALVGLVVGAAISLLSLRLLAIAAAGIALAAISFSGTRTRAIDPLATLRHDRVTMSSPDRAHAIRAAVELARDHPVAGVGPGNVDLTWNVTSPMPVTMHVSYAHNEYLQTLDEVGAVGLAVLIVGFLTVGKAIWRARHDPGVVAASGCVSALVALAIHSSMDFLWHVPVVALTGAVLVGALLPNPNTAPTEPENRGRHA